MEGARQQVSSVQSQITGLQGQIAAEENRKRSARSSPGGLDGQIAVARAELDRLIKRLGAQESIKSEMSGRVIDIRKSRGDTVQQGDVVAVLEDTTATVQVVAFVAAGHFRSGLYLSPATAVVMGQLMRGERPEIDLSPFRVGR